VKASTFVVIQVLALIAVPARPVAAQEDAGRRDPLASVNVFNNGNTVPGACDGGAESGL